jgi:hypothetical protein
MRTLLAQAGFSFYYSILCCNASIACGVVYQIRLMRGQGVAHLIYD